MTNYASRPAAGRNIHALDPYRMPSAAALERGAAAARGILKAHRAANDGTYPETVAVSALPAPQHALASCNFMDILQ